MLKLVAPSGLATGALSVLVAVLLGTIPQDDDGPGAKTGSEDARQDAREIWEWLQEQNYQENWDGWPGKGHDFYKGESPHGDFLRTFVNDVAASDISDPPVNSVIVKENYGPDKETLISLTVMVKADGFHPEGGDWWWVKYRADGDVPSDEDGQPIAGKVQNCIQCHAKARGDDYLFTNAG